MRFGGSLVWLVDGLLPLAVEKFAHPLYWRDVNLRGNHYPKKIAFTSLKAFAVPDLRRIPFAEAMKGEYHDAHVGQARDLY